MYKLTLYYYNSEECSGAYYKKTKEQAHKFKRKLLELKHITKVALKRIN